MASYTPNYNLKKPAGTDVVDIDDLNGNMDIVDTQLASLNSKIEGYIKCYGAVNKRYLNIELLDYQRYGSLLVCCEGKIGTYRFSGSATKISGDFTISQNNNIFTVDFNSQYAHWFAIAGGSVAEGKFSNS